jgi:hypothetical protein
MALMQSGRSFFARLQLLVHFSIGVHRMKKNNEPRRVYARPADRSFASYKHFLEQIRFALGGEWNLTEEELREAWLDFWKRADQAVRKRVAP